MTAQVTALLRWTGHPLFDVGIATLCAMAGKSDPEALDAGDLDRAAAEMKEHYFSNLMASYLSCVFTMNSEYTQPAGGQNRAERQRRYIARVLYAHKYPGDSATAGLRCFVSGRSATHLLDRRQMPMLTGEGVLNFFPAGLGGLPVYGPYVTALQALPLGGRRSEGKLLIAHSDNPELTLAIATRFLEDNRRLLNLGKAGNWPVRAGGAAILQREVVASDKKKRPKYPDAKGPHSLVVNDLMELWERRASQGLEAPPGSLTIYLLSNSGQGPSLEMWHLPCNLLRFLFLANRGAARKAWKTLLSEGWRQGPDGSPGSAGVSSNVVVEQLVAIYRPGVVDPVEAHSFVRRHLLTRLRRHIDDAAAYWALAETFLKEVLAMDARRIEAVKSFADTLAEYIRESNDKGLLRSVLYADAPRDLRRALLRADRERALAKGSPLFTLDDYIAVFEAEHNLGFVDWSLVRDLLAIRVLERLCQSGYLAGDRARELLGENSGRSSEQHEGGK